MTEQLWPAANVSLVHSEILEPEVLTLRYECARTKEKCTQEEEEAELGKPAAASSACVVSVLTGNDSGADHLIFILYPSSQR